ncbi:UNVERIFIED_CONTAM: Phospholipase A1 PLIP2, chloroplastic [Sesamum angustifolium]|uniref:Phospholipase A1 PLIP2, chloroplastic n=1 Tax=Sesamum angustifolium TaxID=2727405 RepID=A0AAW2QVU2_9LAMI
MDALCFKAGIHGMVAPPIAAAGNGDLRLSEKASVSSAQQRNLPWGFTFRHPLRSLWPGGKNRCEPAIAVDDAVLVEEKEDVKESDEEGRNGNWVFKILHVRSLWKEGEKDGELTGEMEVKSDGDDENAGEEDEECDVCAINDADDDEKIEFNRESFSKLLRKVPLAEARLYAQMSYLGSLAYSIPQIKPRNLLRYHGLRFVTSSLEKKEQLSNVEMEKLSGEAGQKEVKNAAEAQDDKGNGREQDEGGEKQSDENRISASAAYQIAASAASYLHSHTRSILRFKSSNMMPNENLPEEIDGGTGNVDMINQDMASLMATTDSVTAVVAAKEEVKQAVADDLNSTCSSPCEWFVCDDDQSATRFFVIQGSESLASWQANLLFEPIQFEGLDVLVHRGIYEAAKGIYEQMLPEIRGHLKSHGDRATFRFTGHSLGGSLSLLINLMLLIRGEAPRSSLLPVITFGSPSVMCGGDRLLHNLGLPRNHIQSIAMHRDIVPRAFSCNYPNHVAEFLKAINGNFRKLSCLSKQKLLYAPMGEFLILQPDDKFSPNHDLLPSGSGLYLVTCPESDLVKAEKQIQSALAVFLNSPHPLEILSDRSAYGSGGTIQRDHDMNSYLKSVRTVIRQELSRIRKVKRERRRKVWWPLVTPRGVNAGIVVSRPVMSGNMMGQGQLNFSGMVQTGTESLKRFSRLIASQHMHLLVVLLFPARLLILTTCSLINIY